MQRPSDALPQHSIPFSSAADLEAPLTIDHKCFLGGGGEDGAGGPHVGPYGGRPRGVVVHCLRRCVGNAKPKSFSRAKAILAMSASPQDGFDQFVNRSSHSPLRGGTAFLASLGLRQDEFSSLANDDIVKDCNDGEAAEPPENVTVDENMNEAGVVPRRRKTVLILMSDTGGGHRASAEAIKATFQLEFGDEYEVVITDLWKEYTPWPFNQLPRSYGFLVRHSTLWKATYHVTAPRIVHRTHFAVTSTFIARKVMQGLLKHKPDVIVSVHPLMQHIPLRILKARGLLKKIPFTTVITDLSTCHPTWFHRLVTRCFCPTKEVAEKALKAGLKTTQIRVYGLPIRPSFCKDIPPKVELRRALGMNEELPAVLLMGGGEGMGPVESTAKALGESLFCQQSGEAIGQLVVICGRNMKLVKNLQSINWSIPVQIRGFEKNIEEWMGACDCLITKAGPGTIAEAMIRGLPLILSDYIAGQEVGNVPFVVDNGAGKFLKEPKKIAQTVADWFGPKREELHIMSRNALKLARPDAVFKIVHDLDRLARRKVFLEENRTLVAT